MSSVQELTNWHFDSKPIQASPTYGRKSFTQEAKLSMIKEKKCCSNREGI
jgi:hypothetical protein